MKYLYILLLMPFMVFSQYGIQTPVLAFPGAEGGGRNATGGRGGILYMVDNLGVSLVDDVYHPANCNVGGHTHTLPLGNAEPFYTGGFFAGVEKSDVGYIIFNVSGDIQMPTDAGNTSGTWVLFGDEYGMQLKNKSILGQSAPMGGITISGGRFGVGGPNNGDADNWIIRYIRSRPIYNRYGVIEPKPGEPNFPLDDSSTWALIVLGGDNHMIDHLSLSWAYDKAGGSWLNDTHGSNSATLTKETWSNSIFGDAATGGYTEINPGRTGDPQQWVDEISYLKNLFIATNRTPNMAYDGDGEIINNIIYNIPFKYTRSYHDIHLNHIGNYFKEFSGYLEFNWAGLQDGGDAPLIHSSGNYAIGDVEKSGYSVTVNFTGALGVDNKELWTDDNSAAIIQAQYYQETQHTFAWSNTTIQTPAAAYSDIITDGDVGANRYLDNNGEVQIYQDAVDSLMIASVKNVENFDVDINRWTLPTIPHNTRPGSYDTDFDGMSDTWEIAQFGDLTQSYGGDYDGDGYENIEEYMNQVDGIVEIPVTAIAWFDDVQSVSDIGSLDLTVTWTPTDATNKVVTYSSTNTGVVNNSGAVVGVGTCTLTVTADDTTNGILTDDMSVTVFASETPGLDVKKWHFINGKWYKIERN